MASNYYYLKLHYDILDDWKVGTLPDSLKWRFIQCLCVAGEEFKDGLLPELNQFAYRIREEPSSLNSDMARLAANGLVELVPLDGGERWFITNYQKRQAKIPQDKKQRDYRTRKRKAKMTENDDVVTEMLPERYDSVTVRNTDKIRLDKIRSDKDEMEMYSGHAENTPPHETMSAIACVVKETLAPGFNEDRFEKAAHVIIDLNAVDRVPGFADWWQRNSWYKDNGKANLTTFLDEYQNYLDGVERTKPTAEKLTPLQIKARELEARNQ